MTKISKVKSLSAQQSFTVFPEDLNYASSLFGGKVMAEMDKAAAKVVRRALYDTEADGCVTASFDRIDFKNPGKQGDIVVLTATIKSFGKSSINVRVKVTRESLKGEVQEICAANCTFVAMNGNSPIPHGLSIQDFE